MATRTQVVAPQAFTGTAGQPIANFQQTGEFNVQYDAAGVRACGQYGAQPTDSVGAAYWSGSGSFTDNQYCGAVIDCTNMGNDAYRLGLGLRMTGTALASYNGYQGIVIQNGAGAWTTYIGRVVNGAVTRVQSTTQVWTTRDYFWLEALGAVITFYRNTTAVLSYTDGSPLTGGKPGLCVAGQPSNVGVDDWEAGNLTSASALALEGGMGGGMLDMGRVGKFFGNPLQRAAQYVKRRGIFVPLAYNLQGV